MTRYFTIIFKLDTRVPNITHSLRIHSFIIQTQLYSIFKIYIDRYLTLFFFYLGIHHGKLLTIIVQLFRNNNFFIFKFVLHYIIFFT